MKYQQLTEGLRYQIALLFGEKISLTEISRRVGVSKSTISREIRRNSVAGDYSAAVAQCLSEARRRSAPSVSALEALSATSGFTSMFRQIKPTVANCISICGKVSAVTARATGQSVAAYRMRYLSSSDLRWLMSVAAWVTGKPTLCWEPRVQALS